MKEARRISRVPGSTDDTEEVRSRRLALGMSVDELARALGLPTSMVQDVENGERPMPSAALFDETFRRLGRAGPEDEG